MLLMIENGMRGVVAMISNKYAMVNNAYIKNCDDELELTYLRYLDANNLYG